ncbi:putative metallocarboxypeptidase [Sporobolomyces koalae]|uniref:putative metallocarboxypeptidase n=1 Tax=Sporobolomyces koalae TaxID=500713 RepID=UPI00316ECE3B
MLVPIQLVLLLPFALATNPQIHFGTASSNSDSVHRLSFASRAALEAARDRLEALEVDVWRAGYDQQSRAWQLVAPLGSSPLLPSALDAHAQMLIPSISGLLAQPAYDALQLAALSNASIRARSALDSSASAIHDTYHPFDNLQTLMTEFEQRWGNEWITRDSIGKSWQGNDLTVVTLSHRSTHSPSTVDADSDDGDDEELGLATSKKRKKPSRDRGKIGIVVYGAQHAREWISTSTIVYMMHNLLLHREQDPLVRQLLDRVEFSFVPVVNPDGYKYTWESPSNRLWRKSRQPVSPDCVGIDLNRNWNYSFPQPSAVGCSDSFPGSEPFESIELQRLSDWLIRKSSRDSQIREGSARVRAVLDLHSFGEMLLYPFSSDCSQPPPNAENLLESLLSASKALKSVHGRSWQVGESCQVGIRGGGEGLDWAYERAGIPWSFTAQLRDSGIYGFLLPPSQIRPSGEEFYAALKQLAKFIVEVRT